jgi:hypothetical protein
MAVNASGVPLFASVEDIDDLLITTMEEYDKEVTDELTVNHPLYKYYEVNGLIEKKGSIGPFVAVKLMDKENSTVKDFTHYDDVDNTPQEGLNEAKFAYGHTIGVQMYSREELVKNAGSGQILDLVEVMKEQLLASMANHFGSKIMGTQDADGRSVMGFGRIMAYDQACGAIDPTAAGFGYWNPQRGLKVGGAQYALATEMRAGMRRLVRLCTYNGEMPRLWLMGEDLYDATCSYFEDKLRITIGELRSSAKEKALDNFEMFTDPRGNTYIYSQDLAAKTGWLINTNRTRIRVHSGTNFSFEPWQMMEKKVAKKRNCLLYACVYTRRRNANGYIEFT